MKITSGALALLAALAYLIGLRDGRSRQVTRQLDELAHATHTIDGDITRLENTVHATERARAADTEEARVAAALRGQMSTLFPLAAIGAGLLTAVLTHHLSATGAWVVSGHTVTSEQLLAAMATGAVGIILPVLAFKCWRVVKGAACARRTKGDSAGD